LSEPPLQESNCPEMKFLLEKEDLVRNALVHPTPRIDAVVDLSRENVFLDLPFHDVERIVDSGVNLVVRLCGAMSYRFGDVSLWLSSRDPEGHFPDRVFS
jgi:hypothetical protein